MLREAARRPDLVIRHPGAQPVIVETEFPPARGVEGDACARLGQYLDDDAGLVEQAIAVVLPQELRTGQRDLRGRIAKAEFRYAVFSGTREAPNRWPGEGWLAGGIDDLAACIEQASLSERQVAEGAEVLERGVRSAAGQLRDLVKLDNADTLDRIAEKLHQEANEQTTRMAMAIIANALTFHTAISGTHGILPLQEVYTDYEDGPRTSSLLDCWRRILEEINYWPIFSIASELLRVMPTRMSVGVLDRLAPVAEGLAELGTVGTHELSGQMFQQLIVDRKFLATFYTLPVSAVLLAELAVPRFDVDWGDQQALGRLRIADLACGTGTLLNAAYQSVRRRHRLAGGDDALLHPAMMEQVMVAADIMPAATHLTASILSSGHPSVPFSDTRIVTMPYGEQPTETGHPLAIGSLDLLVDETARSLLTTGGPVGQLDVFGTGRKQVRGTGEAAEPDNHHSVSFPHESGDLLIMNPPFTRPTNHESTTIPVPSFAGFDTSKDEQRAMSAKLAHLRERLKSPGGSGNAGLASYFFDLAHVKTGPGGVVALVLPASFVQGKSWEGVRALLERHYEELLVVSVAASGSTDRAFSADTGMAEVLVVATKKHDPKASGGDTLFVNLNRRPRSLAEGAAVAGAVRRLPVRPSGRIALGEDDVGTFVRAPFSRMGGGGAQVFESRRWPKQCSRWKVESCVCLAPPSARRCPWRTLESWGGGVAFTATFRASIPTDRPGVPSTSSSRGECRYIRCCGLTMRNASAPSWWSRIGRAWSERAVRTGPPTFGRARRRDCTSVWIFESTPRAWRRA